ncbi:hypothetical protein [uncultured Arcticibacterium sp.]|uniref:hypothetical protein n=1 Tax=uncultured Arcticibacterium sp. TaxID=2173042 RepID=UPI0030F51366
MDILTKSKAILILIILTSSCGVKDGSVSTIRKEIVKDFQHQTFNSDELMITINDTINNWKKNQLEGYNYKPTVEVRVDSIIAMNKAKDKIVFAELRRIGEKHISDDLTYMYGVKIEGNWYFFGGPTIVLFRKSPETPHTFEELSDLAYKNIFRHYLKRKSNGELEINEKFFESMENKNLSADGFGSCFECKTFEEYVMYLVKDNWSRRDTTDYTAQ